MKKDLHRAEQIDDDLQVHQDNICNWLLSKEIDHGLASLDETDRLKAIYNGVIKKLIREEHMLLVVEDNTDLSKRMLQIHPNYVQQ